MFQAEPSTQLEINIVHLSSEGRINDFFLTEDATICFKLDGEINYTDARISYDELFEMAKKCNAFGVEHGREVIVGGDYGLSLGKFRYRCNFMRTLGKWRFVLRLLPLVIPDPISVGIPDHVVQRFMKLKDGLVLLCGPTGSGKCLGFGTPVLMFDGTLKMVQDVKPLDVLMGPDSKPRVVLNVTSGRRPMYQINPTKGDAWSCNDMHIMTLKRSVKGQKYKLDGRRRNDGEFQAFGKTASFGRKRRETLPQEVVDVQLNEFLSRTSDKTPHGQYWKLFKVGVDFPSNPMSEALPTDYFRYVGMWIGDGTNVANAITTEDHQIRAWIKTFAWRNGHRYLSAPCKGRKHITKESAKSARDYTSGDATISFKTVDGLININKLLGECVPQTTGLKPRKGETIRYATSKSLPHWMLTARKEQRLALLAGIIDTAGSLSDNCFDLTLKSQKLIEQVKFLAGSLGLAAYSAEPKIVNGIKYHRISISGNINMVPTLLPRKQASPRQQKKDALLTGWSAVPLGEGDYYGFTLDGDGRFLLGDFTVTHNSTTIAALMYYRAKRKREHVLTLEDPMEFFFPDTTASLITQREVGSDVVDFGSGLKAALRQAPNLVMVGEIRDPITAEAALQLSETGHVVVSTLHTTSADMTVQRFMKLIPAERAAAAQSTLADALQIVMCQRLLPKLEGDGRVAIHEIMVHTSGIAAMIRNGNFVSIKQEMDTGSKYGHLTWMRSIEQKVRAGLVDAQWLEDYDTSGSKEKDYRFEGGIDESASAPVERKTY